MGRPVPVKPVLHELAEPIPPEAADPIPPEAADPIPPEAADPIPPEAADPILPESAKVVVPEPVKPVIPVSAKPVLPKPAKPVLSKPAKPVLSKPTKPVIPKPTAPSWKNVNNPKDPNRVMVYNAYNDSREDGMIRLITILLHKKPPTLICTFELDGVTARSKATNKEIEEHFKMKYSAFVSSCKVPPVLRNRTLSKMTVSVDGGNEGVELEVHSPDGPPKGKLALCIQPIHGNFNRATWLIEFIEFYTMMGVEHFFFYIYQVGNNVQKVLDHYEALGRLTQQPWRLGLASINEIRTKGIFAALNDCLYRTMGHYDLDVMVDLDEFIVPRKHKTYMEMVEYLNKNLSGVVPGSYLFKNSFFYLEKENDLSQMGTQPETGPIFAPFLVTQYKTKRAKTYPYKIRSKFFVVPHRVEAAGNHYIRRYYGGLAMYLGYGLLMEDSTVMPSFTKQTKQKSEFPTSQL
ncbi:hypothetical protein LAZ67_20002490 [Cordylochernes scorpioides]|uniref:Glycosyltransferase family 92 protein n=1 Tax=Cordylochernes scorpioides TaxID=51811 RepID=A0ABY6LPZ9_9ARAC|nr:hypothetical protein LAZ67_20002490 [Cordylochernes scorpioides]